MNEIKRVRIGQTALEVAPFALGGNVFGWTLDEKKSFEILDAFIDAGFNFIDTADTYSHWANGGVGGQSETIIGRWLKRRGHRDRIIIASKTGSGGSTGPNDISRKHILETIDQSLQRLNTDYIDLFYTHYDDDKTPVEETLNTYSDLMKAGKIRQIAVSNISPKRLQESLEASEESNLPRYQALQPLYNLVERRDYETSFAPIVAKYGLTVFPYYALASGFLTGKYRTEADLGKSARGNDAAKYLNKKGLGVLAALDQIATKHNTTPATVALAWLFAQPHIGAPISSATSTDQLRQSLASVFLTLDDVDLQLLDDASK